MTTPAALLVGPLFFQEAKWKSLSPGIAVRVGTIGTSIMLVFTFSESNTDKIKPAQYRTGSREGFIYVRAILENLSAEMVGFHSVTAKACRSREIEPSKYESWHPVESFYHINEVLSLCIEGTGDLGKSKCSGSERDVTP